MSDLGGVHWSSVSGGVMRPSPRPFLHAYVNCQGMEEGEIAHSGVHGPCPHRIKVCIVKKDNDQAVIARLIATAGPQW